MIAVLRRSWRSLGFRLAFHVGFLVALTLLTVLSIVYMQTVGVLHHRMERQVTVVVDQLMARFEEAGPISVAADIERLLADDRNADDEIYLLVAPDGRILAGNLDKPPPRTASGGMQQRVVREGQGVAAWLVVRDLPSGGLLVVGRDLRDQEAIESLVVNASLAAGVVAVLLLVGGTFVFREKLEQSVGALRHTAKRIAGGDLKERVALSQDDDEFALLEHDINAMLDRIQSLMDGVRHVSDTIAHNLRTPLTRILTRLRTAAGDGADAAQRQSAIRAAIVELEDLNRVFEKLLQIAEAESGAQRGAFGPVALDTIADDVVELYEAVAEAQGAEVLREPADALWVQGDRDLLAGVVANLLDNALKYGGRGCTVRVGTQWHAGQALLTVQDDGPGVTPEARGRMGTRFVRLQPDVAGHGLGLAGVQAVLALHGGSIRYEDARPGLRVCVELPLASA